MTFSLIETKDLPCMCMDIDMHAAVNTVQNKAFPCLDSRAAARCTPVTQRQEYIAQARCLQHPPDGL